MVARPDIFSGRAKHLEGSRVRGKCGEHATRALLAGQAVAHTNA